MSIAYELALKAVDNDEIPVGAVLVQDRGSEKKLYKAHNQTEVDQSPLSHAENIVIKEALSQTHGKYLNNSVLFTTLEPCPYCAGAIWLAKIPTVYFGAYDNMAGSAGSVLNVIPNKSLNHRPEVYGGIMEKECSDLLKKFFASKRK